MKHAITLTLGAFFAFALSQPLHAQTLQASGTDLESLILDFGGDEGYDNAATGGTRPRNPNTAPIAPGYNPNGRCRGDQKVRINPRNTRSICRAVGCTNVDSSARECLVEACKVCKRNAPSCRGKFVCMNGNGTQNSNTVNCGRFEQVPHANDCNNFENFPAGPPNS